MFRFFSLIVFFASQAIGNYLNCNELRLREIPASVPFHPEWEISPELSLNAIFSQPFTYLGEGHQCIAFESPDGYVLKFPLLRAHASPWWHRLPFFAEKYRNLHAHRIHKKLKNDSVRYLLAFEQLKEETGLVYVHLNRTSSLNLKVLLTDKNGLQHSIDLDHVEFFIQKKAQLLYPAIEEWMSLGQIHQAQQGLSSLVKLFCKRLAKGIQDSEQCLEGNFGFIGTDAIQIDLGHLRKKEPPYDKTLETEKITNLLAPLKQHLSSKYPELVNHLKSFLPDPIHNSPYLLPLNHPIKPQLDLIFSQSRAIENQKTFTEAGFDIVISMPHSFIIVARHPSIPGYVFKLYLDSETRTKDNIPPSEWLTRRCQGAAKIKEIIKKEKIEHFIVPDKWLYVLPASKEHDPNPVILVESDIDLATPQMTASAWKTSIKPKHLDELYAIIKQGVGSIHVVSNIPYTKDGKFACIDTENINKPLKLKKVKKYLSKEMQLYWDNLLTGRVNR